MKKKKEHFERRAHDLTGSASVDLFEDFTLFASRLANFNTERFEAVALKVYVQKGDLVVTLYALDKFKQEENNYPKDKLPIKKFKLNLAWGDLLKHIRYFDFVVSNQAFDIEDMLVLNK
jgi:hypothetical protein